MFVVSAVKQLWGKENPLGAHTDLYYVRKTGFPNKHKYS